MNAHIKIFLLGDISEGIVMKVVLKRRIINAILTIYVPTFLIMIIVYSTNYFKTFFFEAIVTVNLTALLVLTTLFISVSSKEFTQMWRLWKPRGKKSTHIQ